jgi:RNA ligase
VVKYDVENGYVAVDYVHPAADFSCPIKRECRGIKFASPGEHIIGRPFQKFFNHGEKEIEYDWHKPHVVLEKLDGSMVHAVPWGLTFQLHTRLGYTSHAQDAETHLTNSHLSFIMSALNNGWTPIFEYVGPDNRIVVRYDEPQVILTAMRDTLTGYYMSYSMMKHWAEERNVPVVQAWGVSTKDLQGFLHHARSLETIEGFVVRWDDGTMCKIKADSYVRKHRAKDALTTEKNVLALVLNGEEDDLLPILDEDDADALEQYAMDVRHQMGLWAEAFRLVVKTAKEHFEFDRKAFALEVVPKLPDCFKGPAFKVYGGGNPMEELRKHSLNMTTNNAKAETLAKTLNVRWKDYAS